MADGAEAVEEVGEGGDEGGGGRRDAADKDPREQVRVEHHLRRVCVRART